MSLTVLKSEVQSYNDDVDAQLSQKFASTHRTNLPGYDDEVVKARLDWLEQRREHLEKSLHISGKSSDDARWEKNLLKKLEASSRRLSLGLPQNWGDFLAALLWISEKGKGIGELALIRVVKNNPPYTSGEIERLLDIAEQNISSRLITDKYKYLIFCDDELQNFGENLEVIRQYPAFTVVEADEQAIAQLQDYYPIERLSSADLVFPFEGKMRDQKVRFSVPILDEWKQQIELLGSGVKILRALGQDMLVVSVPDEATLEQIKNFERVEYVAPYVPDIRVQMQYLDHLGQEATDEAIAHAKANAAGQPVFEKAAPLPGLLIANFFTTEDRDRAQGALAANGVQIVAQPGKRRLIVDLSDHSNPSAAVELIAEQSGLQSLEEKTLATPSNTVACQIIGEGVIPPNPHPNENTLGLTGEGEIIAVADTGLDTGEMATLHLDFQGRVQAIHSFPIATSLTRQVHNPGADEGAADDSGHGTHVAGSVVGGGEQARALNLPSIKGMASGAKLIFQAIEQTPQWTQQAKQNFIITIGGIPRRRLVGLPDDLEELFAQAYDQGARIHSNSWGEKVFSDYNYRCGDLDNFVWEHKDFLIVVAAGNSGCQESSASPFIQPMSIESPGVAKNCLTVGASENGRLGEFSTTYGEFDCHKFRYSPFQEARLVDSIDHIAAFSSRGPCKPFQRRKPDVLAPGTFVLSTRSSQLSETTYGAAPYPFAKRDYMYLHGTSMATALVAGASTLVRQYLKQYRSIADPSAALVKAAIIHSACYMPDGRDRADSGKLCLRNHPSSELWADYEQGWGRVSLKSILNPDAPTSVEFIDHLQGLRTGEGHLFKIEILDSTVPLRVTLVYTDYPGENLINNLNLLLLSPAFDTKIPNREQRNWGNDFLSQNRLDRANNVEGIVIEAPMCGVWTIKVIATSVPEGPQDFAMVISGGKLGRIRSRESDEIR